MRGNPHGKLKHQHSTVVFQSAQHRPNSVSTEINSDLSLTSILCAFEKPT